MDTKFENSRNKCSAYYRHDTIVQTPFTNESITFGYIPFPPPHLHPTPNITSSPQYIPALLSSWHPAPLPSHLRINKTPSNRQRHTAYIPKSNNFTFRPPRQHKREHCLDNSDYVKRQHRRRSDDEELRQIDHGGDKAAGQPGCEDWYGYMP